MPRRSCAPGKVSALHQFKCREGKRDKYHIVYSFTLELVQSSKGFWQVFALKPCVINTSVLKFKKILVPTHSMMNMYLFTDNNSIKRRIPWNIILVHHTLRYRHNPFVCDQGTATGVHQVSKLIENSQRHLPGPRLLRCILATNNSREKASFAALWRDVNWLYKEHTEMRKLLQSLLYMEPN